jgi:hypothetical protein
MEIKGALFKIGKVALTEGAIKRCIDLQRKAGAHKKLSTDEQMVSVHCAILLKFHAMGDFGEILPSDRLLNRNHIQRNEGRVLSVIGERYPLIVITELPAGDTLISTPEEV